MYNTKYIEEQQQTDAKMALSAFKGSSDLSLAAQEN